ncbi:MAG: glycoside hydrolase family 88 protein [Prolixibacteraceae bacterium]|nr:glycoside hydrolase family 88 protein [Prolixibacteraceae bacterium]
MKKLSIYLAISLLFGACTTKSLFEQKEKMVSHLSSQLEYLVTNSANDSMVPRSFEAGKYAMITKKDWCCGFPAGSYWYLYELTGDQKWEKIATENTVKLEGVQYRKNTHDLGFMVFCSYGNAYRLTKNEEYKKVVIQASESLITRFDSTSQCIKSWDWAKQWQFPVIIDNMMNLEMLFWASKETGDPRYQDVAISHANTTLANHFRENMSSYHVVDYDTITGQSIAKVTHQGLKDDSSWARGQAWGLYGYTVCFRETGDVKYLEAAKKIAAFIKANLPEDFVPYWDYDDPAKPNAYRDASAAAVTASALYMLSSLTDHGKEEYAALAEKILTSLSSPAYLAEIGDNGGFLIKHCVGNMPKKSEVDTPLNYADYYYLEALKYKYTQK